MESEMESIPNSKEKENGGVQRVLSGKDRVRMSEIKLKPCPFCGGEAHIDCFPGLDRPYFPVCNNEMCIACDTIVTFLTEKDAADAWNRRAGERDEKNL